MESRETEAQPAEVLSLRAKPAGEVRRRWAWTEPPVWTPRMLMALDNSVNEACGQWPNAPFTACGLHSMRMPTGRPSIRSAVNHQPESRVREIRSHGSEGGGTGSNRSSLPLSKAASPRRRATGGDHCEFLDSNSTVPLWCGNRPSPLG
jgi:hypothetical protein